MVGFRHSHYHYRASANDRVGPWCRRSMKVSGKSSGFRDSQCCRVTSLAVTIRTVCHRCCPPEISNFALVPLSHDLLRCLEIMNHSKIPVYDCTYCPKLKETFWNTASQPGKLLYSELWWSSFKWFRWFTGSKNSFLHALQWRHGFASYWSFIWTHISALWLDNHWVWIARGLLTYVMFDIRMIGLSSWEGRPCLSFLILEDSLRDPLSDNQGTFESLEIRSQNLAKWLSHIVALDGSTLHFKDEVLNVIGVVIGIPLAPHMAGWYFWFWLDCSSLQILAPKGTNLDTYWQMYDGYIWIILVCYSFLYMVWVAIETYRWTDR